MKTLVEALADDADAPALAGLKWGGRFITNDLRDAAATIARLGRELAVARAVAFDQAAKIAEGFKDWVYVRGNGAGVFEPGSPYDRGQEAAAMKIGHAIRAGASLPAPPVAP